ncbi:MAG: hypothetical protein HQM13_20530 [SAR324 cluster bacterium]|nr:hypothetical protein [SAR324 cluster bacterium]
MRYKLFTFLLLIVLGTTRSFAQDEEAKLDDSCTINVLNRTINVAPDGSWSLPNLPTNMGSIRARATCLRDGVTINGQSDYFIVNPNDLSQVGEIIFAGLDPIPSSLTINPPGSTVLNGLGSTLILQVTAVYPDGSTKDVTAPESGINYGSTNSAIASVSSDGVVLAVGVGSVLITVRKDGASALKQLTVSGSGDTDSDGLPNDYEIANGLNPQDGVDAFEDRDEDGLSALREFSLGTDPNNSDSDGDRLLDGDEVNGIPVGNRVFTSNPLLIETDGDGLDDALEIRIGTDPSDPGDSDFSKALTRIEIIPSNPAITFNTIFSEASLQLQVIGHLINGNQIDLTSKAMGTTFVSSDISVASFGVDEGKLYAGLSGVAEIRASNNGFNDSVRVTVTSFSPTPLSFINLPGLPQSVKISGNYAFVASGEAGVHVVDVSDPSSPVLVRTIDTSGTASDLQISGSYAYVADGSSGLQVIDISQPVNADIVSGLFTGDQTMDLAIDGSILYIANNDQGLRRVSISNPLSPSVLGTHPVAPNISSVDFQGNLLVAADGNSLFVLDASNPNAPVLKSTTFIGSIHDLKLNDGLVHVAAGSNGYQIYDLSDPSFPTRVSILNDFYPLDIVLAGQFSFFADLLFVSAIPYANISNPEEAVYQGAIDLSQFGDHDGNGIDVSGNYVYMTSAVGRLYTAQYRFLEDKGNVSPLLSWIKPTGNLILIEEELTETPSFSLELEATDDVYVASVAFLINGEVLLTDTTAPYQMEYTLPQGEKGVTFGALAVDLSGNVGEAVPLVVNIIPDPGISVIGQVLDGLGNPVKGAIVTCLGRSGTTENDGSFLLEDIPSIYSKVQCKATYPNQDGFLLNAQSALVPNNKGGITDAGVFSPPLLTWKNPTDDTAWVAGEWESIVLEVSSDSDTSPTAVNFVIDGEIAHTSLSTPFQFTYFISSTSHSVTLGALVVDQNGNRGEAPSLSIPVIADSGTIVTGTVVDAAGDPVSGAGISCRTEAGKTGEDGTFLLAGISSIAGNILCHATFPSPYGVTLMASSKSKVPVRGGTTDVGTFTPLPNLPTVLWEEPIANSTWIENEPVLLAVASTADVLIASVQFFVNGTLVYTDFEAPYHFNYVAPATAGTVTIGAISKDIAGNQKQASDKVLSVIPDPKTTVVGKLVDTAGIPVNAAAISCQGIAGGTSDQGIFSIPDVPTISGDIQCRAAYSSPFGSNLVAFSIPMPPVRGNTTNVGTFSPNVNAPSVTWLNPSANSTWIEGENWILEIAATADLYIDSVDFLINSTVVFTDNTAPYQFAGNVPSETGILLLEASVTDVGNHVGKAEPRSIEVIPDPKTTIEGLVLDRDDLPVFNSIVTCAGVSGASDINGEFSISGISTIMGKIQCQASYQTSEGKVVNQSTAVDPIRGGKTKVGVLLPGTTLEGKVLDIAGIPVEGRNVSCHGTSGLTDSQGAFSIGVSVAGNTVQCETEYRDFNGNLQVLQSASIVQDRGGVTNIDDFLVPDPQTTVEGKVLDIAGKPVAGAEVNCLGVSGLTGSNGVFTISRVPTISGNIQCQTRFNSPYGKLLVAYSSAKSAVRDGMTAIGNLTPVTELPRVTWDHPDPGQTWVEGDFELMQVDAIADVFVESVEFYIDNILIGSDETAPYRLPTIVPSGKSNLVLKAVATDLAGNPGESARNVSVISDPGTTVIGTLVDAAGSPVIGASVSCFSVSATTNIDGTFALSNVSTTSGEFQCQADYIGPYGQLLVAQSDTAFPIRGGTVDLGRLSPPAAPPKISWIGPENSKTWIEGETLTLQVAAVADVLVNSVTFLANGKEIHTDTYAPYQFDYTIPVGAGETQFTATAVDSANQVGTSAPHVIEVIRDPGTTVIGKVVLTGTNDSPVGIEVTCMGKSVLTISNGAFFMSGVSTTEGSIQCRFIYNNAHVSQLLVRSEATPPVRSGVTEIGSLELPGNTVNGQVLDPSGNPIAGAEVICLGVLGTTSTAGTFSIPKVSSVSGTVTCQFSYSTPDGNLLIQSAEATPVQNGTINVGTLQAYLESDLSCHSENLGYIKLNGQTCSFVPEQQGHADIIYSDPRVQGNPIAGFSNTTFYFCESKGEVWTLQAESYSNDWPDGTVFFAYDNNKNPIWIDSGHSNYGFWRVDGFIVRSITCRRPITIPASYQWK